MMKSIKKLNALSLMGTFAIGGAVSQLQAAPVPAKPPTPAPAPPPPTASVAPAPAGVAAEVNGEKISMDDLNRMLDYYKKVSPELTANTDEAHKKLDELRDIKLDVMIEEVLLTQEARRQGITATSAEIKQNFDEVKKGFKTDADFQSWLQADNQTPDSLKTMLSQQLSVAKFSESVYADVTVSPDDIRAYYRANIDKFKLSDGITARHILFTLNPKAPTPEQDRVKKRAMDLMKSIKSESDFIDAAKANSDDRLTSESGGALGTFSRGVSSKSFGPAFEAAAFAAPVKKVVGPVQSPLGYHLIFVSAKIPTRTISVEDVLQDPTIKAVLLQEKRDAKLTEEVEDLKAKAKIKNTFDDFKAETSCPYLGENASLWPMMR